MSRGEAMLDKGLVKRIYNLPADCSCFSEAEERRFALGQAMRLVEYQFLGFPASIELRSCKSWVLFSDCR